MWCGAGRGDVSSGGSEQCGSVREGRPPARRHPPARPDPRRHGARAGRRGRLRARSRRSAACRVAFQRKADEPAGPQPRHAADAAEPATRRVSVIRAFSYFSHLANIAEDRHHVRRRARPRARRTSRRRAASPDSFARLRTRRASTPTRSSARSPPRLRLAGAHRASDRGAAQEHARRRARHRRPAGRARHAAQRAPSARDNEAQLARPRRAAVADARAAQAESSPCATRSRTR